MPRSVLFEVMGQAERDLHSAQAEIAKLQGHEPGTTEWPGWSCPANTLRWFEKLWKQYRKSEDLRTGLDAIPLTGQTCIHCGDWLVKSLCRTTSSCPYDPMPSALDGKLEVEFRD